MEQDGIDEQELMRRYLQRLTDWFEPGVVKVCRDAKRLGSLADDGTANPEAMVSRIRANRRFR